MLQCIFRSHSLLRVPLETPQEEIDKVFIATVQSNRQVLTTWVPNLAFWILNNPWRVIPVIKQLCPWCFDQQFGWRYAQHLHKAWHLFHLIFTREYGHSSLQFSHDASKWPHVDRESVWQAKYHFRSAVKPRLYLCLHAFFHKTRWTLVDDFDTWLSRVFE